MNNQQLAGKNAIVTGGSRGIGKAIVSHFAAAGANVLFTYARSKEAADQLCDELKAKYQVNVLAIQADASKADAAQQTIDEALKAFATVDILVNNAGITRDSLLMRMSESQWDEVMDNNLKSVFNYTKAAIKPMMKARSGSIITISSVVGVQGNAGQANYAASKAGVIGFSKSMAKELGSRNIRVNVVAPGYITTDMTDGLSEKVLDAIKAQTPLGRAGSPEEISNPVVFLASDAASYITGHVLHVDGGMAI
jgi:3-oxoacyl-[acyl-carrier protein] reductase